MNKYHNITPPVLVEFWRGNIVESQHRGYYCIVDSAGNLIDSAGNPDFETFLRSSSKPLQAMAVVLSGAFERFGLTDRELAIICGSHGGEDIHTETVSAILAKIGLTSSDLQCGAHPPLDKAAREALCKSGQSPTFLHHNCSGKHTGMLANAVHYGLPIEDYLSPSSRIQREITDIIAILSGTAVKDIEIGFDGCSAPVHGLSMRAAALAFARLIDTSRLPGKYAEACGIITRVMRSYPEMIAAVSGRICTELIRAGTSHELVAKGGAEGYYAVAWKDPVSGRGIGLTVKIEDGSQRARDPLVIRLLQKYRLFEHDLVENLKLFATELIHNFSGREVGKVKIKVQ